MISTNDHIVITGGTGFLGGYILEELSKRGYKSITALGSKQVDLRVKSEVSAVFNLLKPEIIIHAAAVCGGIGANMAEPTKFIEDNTKINLNVVEASCYLHKSGNFKKFVGIGTICSYPNITPVPFKEDNLFEGYPEYTNAPYGLSKRLLLAHINACRDQYNFPGIFLIPVNMYGERDSFDPNKSHVIPALIKKIHDLQTNIAVGDLVCWGTGTASREFFYASDAARGIVDAMEKYNKPDPVNLGVGQEVVIKDLVSMLIDKMNFTGNVVWDSTKPDGQPRRCLDVSRAKKEFGFEANINLSEGLDKVIEWYRRIA